MSIAVQSESSADWRWLYSRKFDLFFILGFLGIAMAIVALVIGHPALFIPILLADLWLLGYHHVISTYTRLCFDKESFRQHKSLIIGLLPAVAIGTLALAWGLGIWAVFSLYFY